MNVAMVAVEVFSGAGAWAKAMRAAGFIVIEIDVKYKHDLTKKKNCRFLSNFLRSGLVDIVHLGTPCHSFTRARERGNGPGPLRSSSCPLGLPDLSALDKQKVVTGNALALLSSQILTLCYKRGIPAGLENPALSRLWELPSFLRLAKLEYVKTVKFDFCLYGAPWRKRTQVMYFWVDIAPLARLCTSHHGSCDRTTRPHQILEGKKPGTSIFWTAIAEPYPKGLCKKWAQCFKNKMAARALSSLATYCT